MKIWVITIGEPLPTDGADRLLRTGILVQFLADAGHDVIWWSSAFDHVRKKYRESEDSIVALESRYVLHLLKGCGYKKNLSLKRLYDHYLLARQFKHWAKTLDKPDIILCSFPAIELSYEAVKYGKKNNVPVVLDVRDLWPDVFLDYIPEKLGWLAKIVFSPLFKQTEMAFKGADAITAISEPFVEWGLKKGQRKRSDDDKFFPMGYPQFSVPSNDEWMREKDALVESYGISENTFVIVFFGYIGHQFDLEMVINSAAQLNEIDVKFILCGTGQGLDNCLKKSQGLKNIFFPGWVNQVQIRQLMAVADVGLMPYVVKHDFLKSIPNKFFEYLSAGLPVLTTLGDGVVGDLIKEYDCGRSYSNSEDLYEEINLLYGDKLRMNEMKEKAFKLFHDRFEASLVYGSMARYLESIANK